MPIDLQYYDAGTNTPERVDPSHPLPVVDSALAAALTAISAQLVTTNDLLFRILLSLASAQATESSDSGTPAR